MENNKKEAALTTAGVVAGVAATKLFVACGVCIATFIGAFALIIFALSAKLNGKKFTKRGLITIIVLLLILVPIFGYHRFFCHRPEEKIVNSSVEEEKEKTEDEEAKENTTEENANEETSNVSDNNKKVVYNGYCPENQKIEATYNNAKPEDASNTVVETTDPSKEEVKFVVENNEEERKKQEEEMSRDIEEGKTVVDIEKGIEATTDPEKAEEKDLTIKEDTTEIKSEESGENNKEENSSKTEEDFTEANEDELDNLLENTEDTEKEETTEEVVTEEVVTEEEAAEGKVEISDITEETLPEKITEEKEEERAVSVTAIDGYTANINSTVQFKIEGDNVTIEGLDGIEYSFSSNILNVNTGAEATVLTVEVSNSISAISFDIVVNGVVNQ